MNKANNDQWDRLQSSYQNIHISKTILLVLVIFLLCSFALVLGVRYKIHHAEKSLTEIPKEIGIGQTYIEHNNERYALNEDIVSILLLGIDRADHDAVDYLNGQCDAIAVVAIDTKQLTMKIISIPRDTMGYISRRTENGVYYDEQYAQLALAHSYGTDNADSIVLAQRSISNFLYGVPITKTVQFNVLGVPAANDLIDGVTVQLLEDFTQLSFSPKRSDPSMKKGETINLTGKQAYLYLQYRDIHKENSSFDRLQRQIQYFKAYFNKAKTTVKRSPSFILTAMDVLKVHLYTNLTTDEILYLSSKVLGIELHEETIVSIEGQMVQGNQFAEFHADQDKLKELVLDVFYKKLIN